MTKSITLNYTIVALAAIAMVFAYTGVANAAVNSTKINIVTVNRGSIDNVTNADSHTGANTALGSTGGAGGLGGDVTSAGNENNGGASAGNGGSGGSAGAGGVGEAGERFGGGGAGGTGGRGGSAGAGGFVETGDASADAGSVNDLNGTDAEVAFECECGDINSVTLDLITDNDEEANKILNRTGATARSGDNRAEGSVGGVGGVGGDVNGGTGSENNGGASAGTGGAGGSGGLGGEIRTGGATSVSAAVNWLNTTILRVRM